uniref:LBH domain-containing protein n=1 Tax=Oncorhynchus tshawytscha TaxID=74940 RepID=A0AAZ3RLF6_ONCTS
MPTMGVTTLEGVEVCQDGEDFCLTTEGGMEALGAQESSMGEMSPQRNNENRLPFQIFPEPVEVSLSPEGSPNHLQQFSPSEKERLPSIMVEPTDMSEVESGELRWPRKTWNSVLRRMICSWSSVSPSQHCRLGRGGGSEVCCHQPPAEHITH